MNGFAHRIVATERERNVRYAAGNKSVRQFAFDVFTRADKVLCVIVELFNASSVREDVRFEDDSFSREANLFGADLVRPTSNLDFPCAGTGLALFVKSHYPYCSTVATQQAKMFGSKMISSAGKPTSSVRILYARRQISIFRARVSAWPCSSKAITTTAAP